MRPTRKIGLLAVLATILSGRIVSSQHSVGTLRRGQTKREIKPQWLQDRLIARAEAKRARKAAERLAIH